MTQQITTYRVTLGSETRIVPQAEAMDVADAMVRAAGGGVPSIVAIEPDKLKRVAYVIDAKAQNATDAFCDQAGIIAENQKEADMRRFMAELAVGLVAFDRNHEAVASASGKRERQPVLDLSRQFLCVARLGVACSLQV